MPGAVPLILFRADIVPLGTRTLERSPNGGRLSKDGVLVSAGNLVFLHNLRKIKHRRNPRMMPTVPLIPNSSRRDERVFSFRILAGGEDSVPVLINDRKLNDDASILVNI